MAFVVPDRPTTDETTYHWGREDGIFFNVIRRTGMTRVDLIREITTGGATLPQELSLNISEPALLTDDAIAITLATLYGQGCDNITFDLALSRDTLRAIREITRALHVTAIRGIREDAQG